MLEKNKKAQEEIFGFVIIVLIIMIIGLIFFAFSLRRASEAIEPETAQLDDLLQASLSYTTDCRIAAENQSIRDLIKKCYNAPIGKCENNNIKVCDNLNENLENMLNSLLGKKEEIAHAYVHGYILNISNSEQISLIEEGNLTGNYFASSVPIPSLRGENIWVELKFYYSGAE